ncbi:MAG: hypothetical protein O7B81_14830 [Gammaproteobacteria bacterium]|nr:hypothetical protein [Gammaproteobacteria bacterium]
MFTVEHITVYRYRRPVGFGEHRLMFRPHAGTPQRPTPRSCGGGRGKCDIQLLAVPGGRKGGFEPKPKS